MDIGSGHWKWTMDNGHQAKENGQWTICIRHWNLDMRQWTFDIGHWKTVTGQ